MSVKETNQKQRFCAHGKPGQSLVKGFFERASCPREKRRTSMCAALRVCGLNGYIDILRSGSLSNGNDTAMATADGSTKKGFFSQLRERRTADRQNCCCLRQQTGAGRGRRGLYCTAGCLGGVAG